MLSFSYKAKSEVCRTAIQRLCCARAESYGILLYCNTFSPEQVRIITENPEFANRLIRLFSKAFGIRFDRIPEDMSAAKLIFQITDREKLKKIIDILGYDPQQSWAAHVNYGLLEDDCCRTAFLRGIFLAGGSVTDPEKRYHLELVSSHRQASREVSAFLDEMGFFPHAVMRNGNSVIYFKQSEHIEDFLTTVGAPVAATDIMTAKVDKSIRNGANRAANCDIANVNKTINASENQITAIGRLRLEGKLEILPDKLQETAKLRLEYPELSMQQLADKHEPPLTKSCLNHRLRKIMELAGKE